MGRVAFGLLAISLVGLPAERPENASSVCRGTGPARLRLASERFVEVQPKRIHPGEMAILSWSNPYTSEVLLECIPERRSSSAGHLQPIGRFPAKGSLEVWPQVTTTYVISCVGAPCAESISVTVN